MQATCNRLHLSLHLSLLLHLLEMLRRHLLIRRHPVMKLLLPHLEIGDACLHALILQKRQHDTGKQRTDQERQNSP